MVGEPRKGEVFGYRPIRFLATRTGRLLSENAFCDAYVCWTAFSSGDKLRSRFL